MGDRYRGARPHPAPRARRPAPEAPQALSARKRDTLPRASATRSCVGEGRLRACPWPRLLRQAFSGSLLLPRHALDCGRETRPRLPGRVRKHPISLLSAGLHRGARRDRPSGVASGAVSSRRFRGCRPRPASRRSVAPSIAELLRAFMWSRRFPALAAKSQAPPASIRSTSPESAIQRSSSLASLTASSARVEESRAASRGSFS